MVNAAQGNQAAHTAVDNNLNNNDWPYFGTTPEKTIKLNEEKFIKLICKNLNSSECQRKREEVQKYGAKFIISNVIDFIPIIGDIKGLYEAETVGDYVFAAIGVVPLVGDAAKKMHTAQKAYEKAKEAGNVAEMVKQTENVANLIKEDKIRKGVGGNAGKGAVNNISNLNPNKIRFLQNTVSYNKVERGTDMKYTYDDLVTNLKTNGWKRDPVDVIKMPDGKFTSMDNTRIAAAREAGINIKANVRNFNDKLSPSEVNRFSDPKKGFIPTTWGEAITGRINKQSGGFSKNNPFGSNTPPRISGKTKE